MKKINVDTVFITIFVACFLLIILLCVAMVREDFKKETIERNLVSMSNGQTMHGTFFLGIGEINGVMKYRYLYDESGSVRYSESTASCSYINETSDKPLLILKKRYERCGCGWCSHFYIPKGSVKYGYNIDIGKDR